MRILFSLPVSIFYSFSTDKTKKLLYRLGLKSLLDYFFFGSCFQYLILHKNNSTFPFKQEYAAEQKIIKAEEKQKEDEDDDRIKAYIKGKEMMADLTREKVAETNRWV